MLVLAAVATASRRLRDRPPRPRTPRCRPPHERRARIEHHAAVRRPRAAGAAAGGAPALKKLRLLAILVPLGLLAIVSTVFGMMMAVASDLPELENRKEYQDARNSVLSTAQGKRARAS